MAPCSACPMYRRDGPTRSSTTILCRTEGRQAIVPSEPLILSLGVSDARLTITAWPLRFDPDAPVNERIRNVRSVPADAGESSPSDSKEVDYV